MFIKLIRDKLSANENGPNKEGHANTVLGKQALLFNKLYEEIAEIAADPTDPYEYADVLEALFELARINKVPIETILKCMQQKRRQSGGFREGKYIYHEVR